MRRNKAETITQVAFLETVLAELGDGRKTARDIAALMSAKSGTEIPTQKVSSSLTWLHYTGRVEKFLGKRVPNINGPGSNYLPEWQKATAPRVRETPVVSEPVRVLQWPQSVTAAICGDPAPGRSALAQREARR